MYSLPAHLVPIIAGVVVYVLQSDAANKSHIIINFVDGGHAKKPQPITVLAPQAPEDPEPVEEWEGLHPYPGSVANFWDEADLIERSLSGNGLDMFWEMSGDMEEFLCNCRPREGFEAQKAMILIMTTINCSYGNNSAFPRNPFFLEAIFDEGIGILKGAVSAAARDDSQRRMGADIVHGLSIFFRIEGVLARANF